MKLPRTQLNAQDFSKHLTQQLKQFGFCLLDPVDAISTVFLTQFYNRYRSFFASHEKHAFRYDHDVHDGYASLALSEKAKGHSIKDYKEFFHYFPWGRCPDSLAQISIDLFNLLKAIAEKSLSAIEEDLPKACLANMPLPLNKMIKGSSRTLLRIAHYPPFSEKAQANKAMRAAEHQDINLITVQPASDITGLECQLPDGSWQCVDTQPGSIFIGVGEMLEMCTGGLYPSVLHRVKAPQQSQHNHRIATMLFLHPRSDVKLNINSQNTASNYLHKRLSELGLLAVE